MAEGICSAPQEEFMRDTRNTPHIVIAIGDDLRTFRAFITGAPARLDAPSTITLYESTPSDFTRFAMSPDDLAPTCSGRLVRLVLVAVAEEKWQHARYAEEGHHLAPPDHVMVSAQTLQIWLWRRLRTSLLEESQIARVG